MTVLNRNSFALCILFFLACFSCSAHATTYYWQYGTTGATGSTPAAACQSQVTSQGGGVWSYDKVVYQSSGSYMCYYKYNGSSYGLGLVALKGDSCPSGTSLYQGTSNAQCVASCPTGGTYDSGGTCTCPAGQVMDYGPATSLLSGYTKQCATPAQRCSNWANKNFYTNWPTTSQGGCATTCAVNGGTNSAGYGYYCWYTGGQSTSTTSNATTTAANTNTAAAPLAGNPAQSQPLPAGVTAAPNGPSDCASGASFGYYNGQAVCAGGGSPTGAGTPLNPTVPTGTTITNTTTSTSTNPDGTTSTTTVVSTVAGGSGTGTGTGTGTGSGSGSGGGDCNPDAKTYLDCQEVGTGPSHTTNQYQNGSGAGEAYVSGLKSVPIVAAISNLSGVLSTQNAECPAPTFEIFGQTFAINMHCTLYDSVSGILSTVMLIVWSIRGVKIIASA